MTVTGVPEVIIVLQIFQKDTVIKLIIPVVINTRCGIVHLLPLTSMISIYTRITRGSSGIEDSGKELGSKTPRLKG